MKKRYQKSVQRNVKSTSPPEDVTQIVQGLLKCGHFLQREMNQVCQRFGLKQQQFSVLNEIIWHGPLTQKELGERLLFEKSNVSKIVKILFERKWIGVAVATHDRRKVLLPGKKACKPLRNQALNLYQFYPKTSSSTP
jgi:hypothetical protein